MKTIILIAAFVLPVGIFLFLKTMGKNEFAVEPYYETGVINRPIECGAVDNKPYKIPDAVLNDLLWSASDSLVLYIIDEKVFDEQDVSLQLEGLYKHNELRKWKIVSDSSFRKTEQFFKILERDKVTIDQLKDCFFIMEENKNAVLIDRLKRIRGYYDLSDRKEVDRLVVEIKIILKKY